MADNHLAKMQRGWLLPYLSQLDVLARPDKGYEGHGRWAYWLDACERGVVPEAPIPSIEFTMWPNEEAVAHIKEVLDVYVGRGYWYDDAWLVLVKWLLHGFGRWGLEEEVERIPADVRNQWYELFDLSWLLRRPAPDWSAYILQGCPRWMNQKGGARWAKSTAFFATPINVSRMMAEMTFCGIDPEEAKVQSVCDPCVGTGGMLLVASNHSLLLYGMDIVSDLCLCTELNGWLWAPWMVYMPDAMRQVLERARWDTLPLDAQPAVLGLSETVPVIRLETEPAKVAAVQAYRRGELSQSEMIAATLGRSTDSAAEKPAQSAELTAPPAAPARAVRGRKSGRATSASAAR